MSRRNGDRVRYLSAAITALWVAAYLSPLPSPAQEKAHLINLGYSSVSGSQAILRVTKDAGIFSKNGLDASLVLIAGGTGMIQALIAGDLPIAVVSGEPAILARLQGADTVILAGLINIIDFSIITVPEIKKPQDLKGKKLGVSRFGSSTDFVTRYALDKWGLVPDRDVAILQIGSQPARLAAMKSGTVPRTFGGPPGRYRCPQVWLQRNRYARATQSRLSQYVHCKHRFRRIKERRPHSAHHESNGRGNSLFQDAKRSQHEVLGRLCPARGC